MNLTKISALILFLTCLPTNALAEQGYFRYGIGILDNQRAGAVKAFSVGITKSHGNVFVSQYELGLFTDSGSDRKSSGTGSVSGGVHTQVGALYLASVWGLAALTHPNDARMTGRVQFCNDIIAELRGTNGVGLGFSYRHMSNAGYALPNKGRDFVTFRMSVGF